MPTNPQWARPFWSTASLQTYMLTMYESVVSTEVHQLSFACRMRSTSNAGVSVFIAHQHTDARYWYSKYVRPSVRPSVFPLRSGIRWKRLNISSQVFNCTVAQSFWFYQHHTSSRNSDGVTPYWCTKYRWGI